MRTPERDKTFILDRTIHVMDRLASCLCSVYILQSSQLFCLRNSMLTWTLRIISLFSQTKYYSGSVILMTLDLFTASLALISGLQFLDSCHIPKMLGTEFLPHILDTLKWNEGVLWHFSNFLDVFFYNLFFFFILSVSQFDCTTILQTTFFNSNFWSLLSDFSNVIHSHTSAPMVWGSHPIPRKSEPWLETLVYYTSLILLRHNSRERILFAVGSYCAAQGTMSSLLGR